MSSLFKRYEELETENEILRDKLLACANLFGGIYEKCNIYLNKKNCIESLAGIRAIKEIAELGLDIKKESRN